MEFEPVKLNNLYNLPGSKRTGKRVGRGIGSGKGKQCGRGTKGQKARAGVAIKGFEGGQMPIIARLPKRGFNPIKRHRYNVVNLELVNYLLEAKLIKAGQTIDKTLLLELGVIKKLTSEVKLLGNVKLSDKVNFELDAYSETAKTHVLEVGGEVK
jgi:large subunit ribosomal protein L15